MLLDYKSVSLQNNAKVAVLGAAGGIGQPLSLLLKNSPLVSQLSLYDIAHTPGVAADLSHIETRAQVTGTALDSLSFFNKPHRFDFSLTNVILL